MDTEGLYCTTFCSICSRHWFLEHVQTLLETRHAPPRVDGDCLHSSLFRTLCLECIDSIAYLVEVNVSFFTLVCNAVIVFCN